jgi:hypothetical protein
MKHSYDSWLHRMVRFALGSVIPLVVWCSLAVAQSQPDQPELNDVHFHLTNYIQEGTDIHDVLKIMGTKVGRVALFGIPLQQEWSYQNSGDFAPTYYLQTDAPALLLLLHRLIHCDGIPLALEGAAGALRSHDHRVQPG